MQVYQGFLVQLQTKTADINSGALEVSSSPIVRDERYVGRKRTEQTRCGVRAVAARLEINLSSPHGTPKKGVTAEIPSDLRGVEFLQLGKTGYSISMASPKLKKRNQANAS